MKALTIRQPWASLVISGQKDVENRNYEVRYRGPLVITAAQAIASAGEISHLQNMARMGLVEIEDDDWITNLPRGCVLGTVELVDVRMNHDSPWTMDGYSFQWILANPKPAAVLEPVSGKLGIWEYTPEAEAEGV